MLVSFVENAVDVVDQVVAQVDYVKDDPLDPLWLEPWLSGLVVDLVVSSEERVEHAQLVHHHP